MSGAPARLLFIFLDGVGIGVDDPTINPFVRAELPTLRSLCGGAIPLLAADGTPPPADPRGRWVAADATLGVPGRPQSGTGQTSLLTGENAAARFGRHFGPWVPTPLRDLLAARNLLSRARAGGRRVSFANAYPAGAYRATALRRPAAPPLAALAAGALDRDERALRARTAVSSSITNEGWRRHIDGLREITPESAGAVLAALSREADLTLFAHYDTDLVGHRRDPEASIAVLNRVDRFLAGLLEGLAADTLLVIASDHGNLEDVRVGHTVNPVPVIARGPGGEALVGRVRSILDVTPAILGSLNVESL